MRLLRAAPLALRARRAPHCMRRARSSAAAAGAPPTPLPPTHQALLIDVGGASPTRESVVFCARAATCRLSACVAPACAAPGCLLSPAEPVVDTYLRYAAAHGVRGLTRESIAAGFRAAFSAPRTPPDAPRYAGDGAAFWRAVVAAATRSDDPALFAALHAHYDAPSAWTVAPGAPAALRRLRAAGVRLAVVSNWDTRLRALLAATELSPHFDAVIVSAELGVDKPDPRVFRAALRALGDVSPGAALMIGDDATNDVAGAAAVGVDALLWGSDVRSFGELADRVLRA
jgi:REG-2-like HAD superfamily hydrolase